MRERLVEFSRRDQGVAQVAMGFREIGFEFQAFRYSAMASSGRPKVYNATPRLLWILASSGPVFRAFR